jgi:hypothetical protein
MQRTAPLVIAASVEEHINCRGRLLCIITLGSARCPRDSGIVPILEELGNSLCSAVTQIAEPRELEVGREEGRATACHRMEPPEAVPENSISLLIDLSLKVAAELPSLETAVV